MSEYGEASSSGRLQFYKATSLQSVSS